MKIPNIVGVSLFFVFIFSFISTATAQAGEISYGHVADIMGDTLLLNYKGPAGEQFFTCTTSGSCTSTTTTSFSPAIAGLSTYTKSADGMYGVRQFSLGTITYYILYDLTKNPPERVSVIPFLKQASTIRFSPSGKQVVFIAPSGIVARYDIPAQKLSTVTISQTEFPFLSLSSQATYLTAYNYNAATHNVWRLSDGVRFQIPSTVPSYVEFSGDESQLAYLSDVGGFNTLFVQRSDSLTALNPQQVTRPNAEVEDYLYVGDILYYLANPDHPLSWNLYAYTSSGNKITLVDKDVSYGDFIKRIDSKLAYIKVDGKNANVRVYDPSTRKTTALTPVPTSSGPSNVQHEAVAIANRTGVLLSPTQTSSRTSSTKRDLFVWMHGGPQRQIAVGYHPYLSYAVYDELLDRLASAGSYVLKLDYTGSTGYGSAFEQALHKNIGVTDVDDVEKAVAEFKKDHKVRNVYLIGNSYGGYLALKTITHSPDVFKGAISIAGVTDWYGLIERIPSSPFKDLFDGVPDLANLDAYLRASVFTDIPKLTSDQKVLIVYGEDDATVPTWQSTQYLDYAKSKNLSVDSISFPGEDHILRKRNTLDKLCSKISSFFALKGVSCSI